MELSYETRILSDWICMENPVFREPYYVLGDW